MNHENWEARGRQRSRVVAITARVGMAAYSRGADANAVMKLAKERLKSERPPAKADQPSLDLASCASQAANGGSGREL